MQYLWRWWQELRGYEALTFTEIHAWVELTGVYIDREEILALRTLDTLYWRLATSE